MDFTKAKSLFKDVAGGEKKDGKKEEKNESNLAKAQKLGTSIWKKVDKKAMAQVKSQKKKSSGGGKEKGGEEEEGEEEKEEEEEGDDE